MRALSLSLTIHPPTRESGRVCVVSDVLGARAAMPVEGRYFCFRARCASAEAAEDFPAKSGLFACCFLLSFDTRHCERAAERRADGRHYRCTAHTKTI
jgi:hypothetical protein